MPLVVQGFVLVSLEETLGVVSCAWQVVEYVVGHHKTLHVWSLPILDFPGHNCRNTEVWRK